MTQGGRAVVRKPGERHGRVAAWGGGAPVLWLFLLESVLVLLLVPLLFYLGRSNVTATFLLIVVAIYGFYFWLAFYAYVEFELWRRTGNLGHLYQFIGSLLIVVPILWAFVPFFLGLPSLSSGILSVVLQALTSAAGSTGLVMALYGYYHRPFHARDVDLYRNVVVRAGEHVDALTDGYSTRVFETRYEGFPTADLRGVAEAYALRFQRSGFYLAHRSDDQGITLYPVAYAGLGTFRWGNALRHLYRLARHPERLTWVRIDWTGLVQVHVSPEDYARIHRPVAHHLLCAAVADAVVGSLLAYARDQEPAAVAALLGPAQIRSREQYTLPGRAEQRDARIMVVFATALLVAGTTMTGFSVVAAESPYLISNVHWSPVPLLPGETLQIFATLTSLQDVSFDVNFGVIWWSYFGPAAGVWPPPSGFARFSPYQGNEYVAGLGPFANGTEVTFVAALEQQGSLTTRLIQSPAYAVDVGTVLRGGSSGLALSGPQLQRASSDSGAILGVWINSSAPVTVAQVLVAGSFAYTTSNGGGSFGLGSIIYNLTATDAHYWMYFAPNSLIPTGYTHLTGTLDFEFVAQDATGNTARSAFTAIQFNEAA